MPLLGFGPDKERVVQDLESVERILSARTSTDSRRLPPSRGLRHRPQVRGRGLSRTFSRHLPIRTLLRSKKSACPRRSGWPTRWQTDHQRPAFTFLSGHGRNLQRKASSVAPRAPCRPATLWETNPSLLRWHAGAHFTRGINRIQMHSFGYSPPGLPPPGWRMYAEVHLSQRAVVAVHAEFSRWIARNQLVLQSGGPAADALVYPVRPTHPTDPTIWRPTNRLGPSTRSTGPARIRSPGSKATARHPTTSRDLC